MWVSTFHALCARLLRREAPAIGLSRDFVIYDSSDQLSVVKQALKELHIDDSFMQPRAALSRISHAKNRMETPDAIAAAAGWNRRDEQIAKIYAYYLNALKESNALDFDDLLLKTVDLFEQSERVRTKYAEQFRFVMVDEYQDTNRPQYLLIRRLAEVHRNLCVVGDPDQSIYKWRGADLRNILDFEQDFPEATIVKLERNYRSTQIILDAASAVISQNRNRKDKRLWTDRKGGARIVYFRGGDELEEADFITRTARTALADDVDATVAVLYRTNAQSRTIEDALMREGARLQDRRRRAVLRAQGNQGRAGLHAARHQPARRCEPAAGDQRAGARHRQGRDGGDREDRARRRRTTTTCRCSRPACSRRCRPTRSGRASCAASRTARSPAAPRRRSRRSAISSSA